MTKQILFLLIFSIFISFHSVKAQTLPEPSGRRLRAIVKDKFSDNSIIIGGSATSQLFGTNTGLIMDREFSYVTPTNDFKQSNIHPDNSFYWNWVKADAWVNHIAANSQILRMHCPIGPQCSEWAQDDRRTASELETNMVNFMRAVCERYNGTPGFEYMDVVNETVSRGNWHTDKPGYGWENPWFKIGQDTDKNKTPLYIKKAFQIASQFAPEIKLIYNHNEAPEILTSWALIKETIVYLRDQGLRVDGIGWQAHLDVGWETSENLQNLRELIDWAHDNQLEFHITEASVWLKQGVFPIFLEQQAKTYRSIVEVLLDKRSSGKVGWNIWHIDDGHGWHTEWHPSLFDADYSAKPAYYAIQEALEKAAPTNVSDNPDQKVANAIHFELGRNYPNPFNSSTLISYQLARPGKIEIVIYNVLGEKIKTLVNEEQQSGAQAVVWDGTDAAGNAVSTGIYYYQLVADNNRSEFHKMILLK